MVDQSSPILYYRTSETKSTLIDDLPESQKIMFVNTCHLETLKTGNITNDITEPEISPSGEKTYHKQEVGGMNEILMITGRIEINDSISVGKIKKFLRLKQLDETHFPFGKFGFYHDMFDAFNVDPTTSIGYTIDRTNVSFGNGDVETIKFDITLSLGGKNLV